MSVICLGVRYKLLKLKFEMVTPTPQFLSFSACGLNLLIEAALPRLLKKTKQTVATGDLNITQRLLFIQVPKQGPTKILAYSDFFFFEA